MIKKSQRHRNIQFYEQLRGWIWRLSWNPRTGFKSCAEAQSGLRWCSSVLTRASPGLTNPTTNEIPVQMIVTSLAFIDELLWEDKTELDQKHFLMFDLQIRVLQCGCLHWVNITRVRYAVPCVVYIIMNCSLLYREWIRESGWKQISDLSSPPGIPLYSLTWGQSPVIGLLSQSETRNHQFCLVWTNRM